MVAEQMPCGADVAAVRAGVQEYLDAGATALHLHQIGSDQEQMYAFYRDEVLPRV